MSLKRNAWGRLVDAVEGQDVPVDPDALRLRFREVGLEESDARAAAEGLIDGRYLSFADAAQSRSLWGPSRVRDHVSAAKIAEVAATLDGPASGQVIE